MLDLNLALGGSKSLNSLEEILQAIGEINPKHYHRTRNFLDGAVTRLSPYITHGIIDTVDVTDNLLAKHNPKACYKLMFELGWREYFHRVWQNEGDKIFKDLYQSQHAVESTLIPAAIFKADTGITVIDSGIKTLYSTGLMHNHLRMWVSSISCNIGHTHWFQPAHWMYYHLLDGDLASNFLSWQWIAGTASHRQYFANQEILNKFSKSTSATHGSTTTMTNSPICPHPTYCTIG